MKLKLSFPSKLFFFSILIITQGVLLLTSSASDVINTLKIGVILDTSSRMGKEQKTAMPIAIDDFNKTNFVISTDFIHYNHSVLQTAIAGKDLGLMRSDSLWITTEAITSLRPSFHNLTMSSMEGVLGIMRKFDNSMFNLQVFEAKFGIKLLEEYENEMYNEPSYQGLLSYDALDIIVRAKYRLLNNISDDESKSKSFLKEILQSNFTGLSGQVSFNQDHNVAQNARTKLVKVVGAKYFDVLDFTIDDFEDNNTTTKLATDMNWQGNSKGNIVPKGWKMPTNTKRKRIGVPIAHTYKNFIDYHGIKFNNDFPSRAALHSINNKDFSGYCIGIFDNVVKLLGYELPYQLIPFNSSYDELVNHVHNKVIYNKSPPYIKAETFDAAVGDMTILVNRAELVDFTHPFAESGLSIVLPAEESYNSHGAWIFLKPFTTTMWVVALFVFMYTMMVIWLLEHGEDSDSRGPWENQVSSTAWFAFTSLYFAQREKISTKLARVVVTSWLFIVLILTQSYTANLTSMLTNERLNQSRIDVEMLQRTNAKVGYDNSSFLANFLETLLRFDLNNFISLEEGKFEDFHQKFQDKNISAACLEYLYAKLFLTKYCKQYIMTRPNYRFGGFGFVFGKGSPIAVDVSEAILRLTENGTLKTLEKNYLKISSECTKPTDDGDEDTDDGKQSSLSLASFRIPFIMSAATTTACFLASCIPWYRNNRRKVRIQQEAAPVDN